MACRKYQKWLPLFIDQALSERQQQQISAHLLICEECLREVEILKKVLQLVGGLQQVKAPADFYLKCNERFECELASKPKIGLWLPLAWGSAGAAVMLAGLLIVPTSFWKPLPHAQSNLLAESRPAAEPVSMAPSPESFTLPMRQALPLFRRPSVAYRNLAEMLPPPPGLAQPVAFSPAGELAMSSGYPLTAEETFALAAEQEWRGDHCAIREATSLVAKSQEELLSLSARAGIAPPAEVDWDAFIVVAIFAGQQTGPKKEIRAMLRRRPADGLAIRYRLEQAEPAAFSETGFQPYLLMVLPRTVLPVQVQGD